MLIMKKYNRIAAALTTAAIVLLTGCGDTMDHVTIHSTESSSETEMEKSNETEAENSDSVESASVNETDTEYSDAIVDMDEYYAKVSTVIRKIAAEDSKAVQNEQAAVSDITARGFEDFPITINYDEKGQIIIDKEECDMDGDDLMMLALDAGAEDFSDADDSFEITTAPEDFDAVHKALEEQNIPMASAEVTMIPQTYVTLTDEADITNIGRILDFLDDDDDVQEVYHNWEE